MRFCAILRAYLNARRRFTHLCGDLLREYQENHAQNMVQYAIRHSPFYRHHFHGLAPAQWQQLPTVDKALMMANFDTYNTAGISLQDAMAVALEAERSRDCQPTVHGLTVGLSSGTSNHRGLFLVSPCEEAIWVGTILARGLPGLRLRGYRIALFLRANSNLYTSVRSQWIDFQYYHLMTPLAEATNSLNTNPPDILIGPPSILGMLAKEKQSGELKIAPERVVSVAEVLEPQDDEYLQEVFGGPIHQIYQCTEGLLGVTCAHGRTHMQEDLVHIQCEPLDASCSDSPVTPIVTDLVRRTQPMIRYRLNDVLTLDPSPCPCGSAFRVIHQIQGRCDDICYFKELGGGLRAIFPDVLRRMVLTCHAGIRDYRIIQKEPGSLIAHLDLVAGTAFEEVANALRQSTAEAAARYDCEVPRLTIEPGLLPNRKEDKRRRIRRID